MDAGCSVHFTSSDHVLIHCHHSLLHRRVTSPLGFTCSLSDITSSHRVR
jgi:hypothetical protein